MIAASSVVLAKEINVSTDRYTITPQEFYGTSALDYIYILYTEGPEQHWEALSYQTDVSINHSQYREVSDISGSSFSIEYLQKDSNLRKIRVKGRITKRIPMTQDLIYYYAMLFLDKIPSIPSSKTIGKIKDTNGKNMNVVVANTESSSFPYTIIAFSPNERGSWLDPQEFYYEFSY